jgi:hypothetical protein
MTEENPKFIAEMNIEYAIKQSRNVISLSELARAINQSLLNQEELKALISNLQQYVI